MCPVYKKRPRKPEGNNFLEADLIYLDLTATLSSLPRFCVILNLIFHLFEYVEKVEHFSNS